MTRTVANHSAIPSDVNSFDELPVLFVSRSFPPVNHSGTIRSEAFAHYSPEFGIRPIILCEAPGSRATHRGMTSAKDDHYVDDPRSVVSRIDWPTNSASRLLSRLPGISFLTNFRSLQNSLAPIYSAVDSLIAEHSVRAIFATYSPADNLIVGRQAAQKHGLPLILDLRDPWTHLPNPSHRHWLDGVIAHRIERSLLVDANVVVVTTHAHAKLLIEEIQVPAEKVVVIHNGFDERDFEADANPPRNERFTILHAGQMCLPVKAKTSWKQHLKRLFRFDYEPLAADYEARSPLGVLQAVTQLERQIPGIRKRIAIRFSGVSEREEQILRDIFPWPEVISCKRRVPQSEAAVEIHKSDLLLLLQIRTYLRGHEFSPCIPAKLFTYLRAGKRVLGCVSEDSEMSALIRRFNSGTVVSPDSVSDIADAILAELNAWESAEHNPPVNSEDIASFNRRNLAGKLSRLIQNTIQSSMA